MCNCKCCCQCNTERINSDNVYYSGPFLSNINVNPNEDLTSVIQDIDNAISNITAPNQRHYPGVAYFNPDGISTNFTIIHNIPDPLISASVNAGENTSPNFIIDINPYVTIKFSVAPPQGTQIKFYYTLFY